MYQPLAILRAKNVTLWRLLVAVSFFGYSKELTLFWRWPDFTHTHLQRGERKKRAPKSHLAMDDAPQWAWHIGGEERGENRESRVEEQQQRQQQKQEQRNHPEKLLLLLLLLLLVGSLCFLFFALVLVQFSSFCFVSAAPPLWVFVFARFALIPLFCLGAERAHSFCFCSHCHCTALRPPIRPRAVPYPALPCPTTLGSLCSMFHVMAHRSRHSHCRLLALFTSIWWTTNTAHSHSHFQIRIHRYTRAQNARDIPLLFPFFFFSFLSPLAKVARKL